MDAVIDSPLLSRLHAANLVELLPLLFEAIHVPPEVESEAVVAPDGLKVRQVLEAAGGAYRKCVERDRSIEAIMTLKVHRGEAGVIAQTEYHRGRNVEAVPILDDQAAYECAELGGLHPWRTGRVLLELKVAGYITAVKPYLTAMQARGFRLAAPVHRAILAAAGEA